jgi:hypothetical protein
MLYTQKELIRAVAPINQSILKISVYIAALLAARLMSWRGSAKFAFILERVT